MDVERKVTNRKEVEFKATNNSMALVKYIDGVFSEVAITVYGVDYRSHTNTITRFEILAFSELFRAVMKELGDVN